jgi:hypothetical protein
MVVLEITLAILAVAVLGMFCVGSILLSIDKIRARDKSKAEALQKKEFLSKEENLAKEDARNLVRNSARASEHSERTKELSTGVRKRIRDRSKQIVSGQSGDTTSTGG